MTDEEITQAFNEECNRTKVAFDWLSFGRRIAEAEREACAKVCEGDLSMVAWQCADKIRARGEK